MSMENVKSIDLLDHGYIKFIEHWGSDERIIESARMSTDGAFRGWGPTVVDETCPTCEGSGSVLLDENVYVPNYQRHTDFGLPSAIICPSCGGDGKKRVPGDEKLLRYLYEHKHSTPFEFGGMTIEVQAPIFVFREWHRHRTQSYNEMSARYTPLPDLYYMPTEERCFLNSLTNKQAGRAKGAKELTKDSVDEFRSELSDEYDRCERLYKKALADGLPKELARCIMPVGHYSRMRATANLRNWLAFLTLREAEGAQYEIRVYAHALNKILVERFPRTMELFNEEKNE